jgi:hypothetical protein
LTQAPKSYYNILVSKELTKGLKLAFSFLRFLFLNSPFTLTAQLVTP